MQRMSLDRYLSQIHETRESFTAKVHAAAEKNTRARMALLQIAQQENLVPTEEEIDKAAGGACRTCQKDAGRDQGKVQHPCHAPQRGHPPRCRLGDRALHHRGKVNSDTDQNPRCCRLHRRFFRSPRIFSIMLSSLKPMMTMPSTTSTTPVARFRVLGVGLVGKHSCNARPQQGEHHAQHPDAANPARRRS